MLIVLCTPPPASLVAQRVKCLPAMQETWVCSLGREDLLEKEMATHSSTLAWKIPWMEKPGCLQSMGSQRVEHNWVTSLTHSFAIISNTAYILSSTCLLHLGTIFCKMYSSGWSISLFSKLTFPLVLVRFNILPSMCFPCTERVSIFRSHSPEIFDFSLNCTLKYFGYYSFMAMLFKDLLRNIGISLGYQFKSSSSKQLKWLISAFLIFS